MNKKPKRKAMCWVVTEKGNYEYMPISELYKIEAIYGTRYSISVDVNTLIPVYEYLK